MRKKISRFAVALFALAAIVAATPKHALAQGACYNYVIFDGYYCPSTGDTGYCRYCYFDCRMYPLVMAEVGPYDDCVK